MTSTSVLSSSWGTGHGQEATAINNNKHLLIGSFGYEDDGSVGVVFSLIYRGEYTKATNACSHETPKSGIWEINGQAVRMTYECQGFSDTFYIKYLAAYPESKAGQNFLINQFKQSNSVNIKGYGDTYSMSAYGFTHEFNKMNTRTVL